MSKLDQVVYVIENDQVVEAKIRDLDPEQYVEVTTTPFGVGPTYHIREYDKFVIDGEEFEDREDAERFAAENELDEDDIEEYTSYELWTWGWRGNNPSRIFTFDSKEEAEEMLEDYLYMDFCDRADIIFFASRECAEEYLAENEGGGDE